MIELNKVYNEDCLETMKRMPDKSIDLVLTDPPYGIGIDGQKGSNRKNGQQVRKSHEFKGWDTKTPSEEIFKEIFRVSKNQIIWGGNFFVDKLPTNTKGWIVWYKGQKGLTMSDCELAYSSYDRPTRIADIHRTHLWQEKPSHPTQKPVRLFTWCLSGFLKEEDNIKTVYDPFMGSGTTAIACKSLGLDFIGSELDEDYYKIIQKRLSAVQGSLF